VQDSLLVHKPSVTVETVEDNLITDTNRGAVQVVPLRITCAELSLGGSCDPQPCSIGGQIQMPEGPKHNIPKPGGQNFPKTNFFSSQYLPLIYLI
jgi:hypothetical protein